LQGKEMQHTVEEIRELQYWAMRSKGVPVKDAQALDTHLCFLLDIDDPEISKRRLAPTFRPIV
jgi:hypothetical protein